MVKNIFRFVLSILFVLLLMLFVMFDQFVLANDLLPSNSVNATHIIDPNNHEVITTIIPQLYHIEMDIMDFREQIQLIVNRIARKSRYNRPIVLDRIDPSTGDIIKGRPKVSLDEEKLVEQVLEHSLIGGKVYVPLKVTESGYDKEDVPKLHEVVLATYSTNFNPTRLGRSKNIELSAASINNVIVGSGDIFSFNDTVGPRDVAAGYQEAPEFINGKVVIGIGGGICQTSSTLFNAIDKLGMKIIERHRHTRDIGYVPKGRDATVSFGGLDFVFQNTLGIPVLIKAYYGNGYITVQIKTSKEHEFMLKNLEN
ncbi:MAG TPA: VanW family protein [Ureibacillus sp.]|nr:VanW family protein [Ureibacillus sp.]